MTKRYDRVIVACYDSWSSERRLSSSPSKMAATGDSSSLANYLKLRALNKDVQVQVFSHGTRPGTPTFASF
jgi:hypothetical protein